MATILAWISVGLAILGWIAGFTNASVGPNWAILIASFACGLLAYFLARARNAHSTARIAQLGMIGSAGAVVFAVVIAGLWG